MIMADLASDEGSKKNTGDMLCEKGSTSGNRENEFLLFHKVGTTLHALLKLDAEISFHYEAVQTSFL